METSYLNEKNILNNFDARSFVELIERAAVHPDVYSNKLSTEIRKNHEAACSQIIKVFASSGEVSTKRFLAGLFQNMLADLAPMTFLSELKKHESDVFPWAAEILSRLKVKEAISGIKAALYSKNKNAVIASIKGLAEFGNPETISYLVEFFLTADSWEYMSVTMRYLLPHASVVCRILRERYSKASKDKKAWIIKFLAEAGDAESLELFKREVFQQPLELGIFCLAGLGKIGNPEAVKILEQALESKEWFFRKKVVNALGSVSCKEAIPPLIKALSDESVQVRAAAIESLSKVGKFDLESIIAALDSSSKEVKIGLVKVLGQISDPRVVQPLIKMLSNRELLLFTLDSLGNVGFIEASKHIEKFLKDPEWFNRLNALEALGKIKPKNLRQLVEGCLDDPNDMVRNAAMRILQGNSLDAA